MRHKKHERRANGSGTLIVRNGWYSIKTVRNGRVFCKSCRTKDERVARKMLADLENTCLLPRKAKLQAMVAMLKDEDVVNPVLEKVPAAYMNIPKNAARSYEILERDIGRFQMLMRWLHGYHKSGGRCNCDAAHPELTTMNDISPDVAMEFYRDLEKRVSAKTVNDYVMTLKRIWALFGVDANPWKNFGKKHGESTQKRALTKEEIDKLINTAKGELKVMFAIGAYTGLRSGDCANMKWSYFDGMLTTLKATPIKTRNTSGAIVSLPVHPILRQTILDNCSRESEYLTPVMQSLPRWQRADIIKRHFIRCGLNEYNVCNGYKHRTPSVGFHSLRSSFVTFCCEVGAPLAMVQAMVGHMTPEMTQLYYRADVERARQYINRL